MSVLISGMRLSILIFLALLAGCQTPFLTFPGGRLTGPEMTTSSFEFAAQYSTLKLEVNPTQPYSVILRITVIDEALYVDAAPSRRWSAYLFEGAPVRVKIAGKVYPATTVPVSDPQILNAFFQGRAIYRLDPKTD
jgi:hypothetical protein